MLRSLLSLMSPGGSRNRLSILVLHRVLPEPDLMFVEVPDARQFDQLCRWMKNQFCVLPLDEAASRLRAGTLPARAAAITFDDGYADNHDVALPILQRHSLNATFFISTGFLGGGVMWNDAIIESMRRTPRETLDVSALLPTLAEPLSLQGWGQRRWAAETIIMACKYLPHPERLEVVDRLSAMSGTKLPTDLMLSPQQVVGLRRAGMLVGAHTVSHPILTSLDADEQRREMADSKRELERLLGERVGLFAYPNGRPGSDYDARSVAIAREVGFDVAVTTAHGAASAGTDPLQLPRFTPWDRTPLRFGLRMLSNLWTRHVTVPEWVPPEASLSMTETR